ncbi:hypothetical protein KI688_003721 [Linnemannia hyalina]|uniref:Uncharacterized protein n=1 Tax=Linnemannia hyalina TaxID=64524 RepID=A0A9P7XRS7_9FUNG|nr:hypothetical protein KI688_003721 [Linnemannia hyalina]
MCRIPTREAMTAVPPLECLKLLLDVPIEKATRDDSELGHFYKNIKGMGFYCQVPVGPDNANSPDPNADSPDPNAPGDANVNLDQDGLHHPSAQMVQNPEKFAELDDETPRTSPCHCKSGAGAVVGAGAEEGVTNDNNVHSFYQDLHLRVLTAGSISMRAMQSKEFKSLMSFSNPVLGVPGEDSLWSRLEQNNRKDKLDLMQYLRQPDLFGSITSDSWTGNGDRKFLAVTYNYLTPRFTLEKLTINKAWRDGKAEALLNKCNNVAKIFKGKGAVLYHLKTLQKVWQKPLTTQVKNDTRWNSQYEMLKRILDLSIYINMTVRHFNRCPSELPSHIKLQHIKECELSQVEIDTLRELKDVMAPVVEFTDSIGSSAIPTTSLIYTTVRNLLPPLQNLNTRVAKAVHVALDQHIKRAWNLDNDSPAIDAILISMYLNPAILQDRIWDEPNGDSTHRAKAESLITTKIEEVMMKNREW